MIETFLRAPAGAAEATADALRVLAAVGIVVAVVGWGPVEGATVAFAAGGMLLPRLLAVRPSVDIAFGIALSIAAWSSVLEIYTTTRWWDLPVHFVTNGLCAALCYVLLVRASVLPTAAKYPLPALSVITITLALGLSLGVVWEVLEWFGHTFIDRGILVGYTDTIGDLVSGGAGALVAGCCMPFLAGRAAAPGMEPGR